MIRSDEKLPEKAFVWMRAQGEGVGDAELLRVRVTSSPLE